MLNSCLNMASFYNLKCINFFDYSQPNCKKDLLSFPQTPGIQTMMIQMLETSLQRNFTMGSCEPEGLQMIFPNASNANAVSMYQGVQLSAQDYWCKQVL